MARLVRKGGACEVVGKELTILPPMERTTIGDESADASYKSWVELLRLCDDQKLFPRDRA